MVYASVSSRYPPPPGLQNRNKTSDLVTNPGLVVPAIAKAATRIGLGRTNYSPDEDRFIAYHRLYTPLTWNQLAEQFGWRWKARTQGSLQARWNEIKNNNRFFLPEDYLVPDINYPVALANELVHFSKGPYHK